jgi:serine/threonine protein kinase
MYCERNFLQKDSTLFLQRMFVDDKKTYAFHIESLCGNPGTSAVCYRAQINYKKDIYKPGTLKEFYPMQNEDNINYLCDIVRNSDTNEKKNGQLYVNGLSTRATFLRLREEFISAYEKIIIAKQSNKELYAPIQNFELYKGYTDKNDPDNYTVYIWTPYDIEIKTFSEFLTGVCKDTSIGEHKIKNLKVILESIKKLAESVKALHISQLEHLDISPNNFGLQITDGKPNGNISLFDINTVYLYKDEPMIMCCGTRGFRSPDMFSGHISQKCDFFSIGACLYYALIMTENEDGKLINRCFVPSDQDTSENLSRRYINENLDKIDEMLAVSPLFNECDFTEDSEIRCMLAHILKKCLSINPQKYEQYIGAGEIVNDIESVISIWNRIDGIRRTETSENVASVLYEKKENIADKSIKLGAEGAIQWLLYEHPLFDFTDEDKKLNILALGGGIYVFEIC